MNAVREKVVESAQSADSMAVALEKIEEIESIDELYDLFCRVPGVLRGLKDATSLLEEWANEMFIDVIESRGTEGKWGKPEIVVDDELGVRLYVGGKKSRRLTNSSGALRRILSAQFGPEFLAEYDGFVRLVEDSLTSNSISIKAFRAAVETECDPDLGKEDREAWVDEQVRCFWTEKMSLDPRTGKSSRHAKSTNDLWV